MPILTSRRSRPFAPRQTGFALVAGLAVGCGSSQLHTADRPLDDAGPRISVAPASSLPRVSDVAHPNEAVVTLRTPVATEAVIALVRRVFDAFHARTPLGIESDLDDTIVDLRTEPETSQSKNYWASSIALRMKGAPFDQLDVELMYRPQDIEIYAREELGQSGRPARPNSMAADDLFVRIPIATQRVGADVLFGDEIRLLLRRDGSRYKIRGYGEVVPK